MPSGPNLRALGGAKKVANSCCKARGVKPGNPEKSEKRGARRSLLSHPHPCRLLSEFHESMAGKLPSAPRALSARSALGRRACSSRDVYPTRITQARLPCFRGTVRQLFTRSFTFVGRRRTSPEPFAGNVSTRQVEVSPCRLLPTAKPSLRNKASETLSDSPAQGSGDVRPVKVKVAKYEYTFRNLNLNGRPGASMGGACGHARGAHGRTPPPPPSGAKKATTSTPLAGNCGLRLKRPLPKAEAQSARSGFKIPPWGERLASLF